MRPFRKVMIMKHFVMLLMLLISSVSSIQINTNIPDFGKMMNAKREHLQELRQQNIKQPEKLNSDRKYNVRKLKTIKKYYIKE